MKNHFRRAIAHQAWNRFQWHLGGHHLGRGEYIMLHVERLEQRSLLAGDLASLEDCEILPESDAASAEVYTMSAVSDDAGGEAAGPAVDLILELTNPDGSPLTNLEAGQDFLLRVLADDLRDSAQGVFAAYLDIRWDSALAEVAGPLQYASGFENLQRGDASVAGVIDEAGAFGGFDETGAGPHEILSVPMRALGAGELAVTSDAAETPIYQVLVYGSNEAVAAENVQYGNAAVSIEAAAAAIAAPASVTVATAPQAAVAAPVSAPASGGANVTTSNVDAALTQLILQTLLPAASALVSTAAPAANQDQVASAPSAPGLVTLLASASSASTADADAAGDSDEGDESSEEESSDSDATGLNLL